jgi:hypothetical protein
MGLIADQACSHSLDPWAECMLAAVAPASFFHDACHASLPAAITELQATGVTSYMLKAAVLRAGDAQHFKLSQQSSTQPELGPDVASLDMNVSYITPDIMRVKIGAPGRWEFPISLLNTTVKQGMPATLLGPSCSISDMHACMHTLVTLIALSSMFQIT